MSLIQRVSPFLSPHERGYMHSTTKKRSLSLASIPKLNSDIMVECNEEDVQGDEDKKMDVMQKKEVPDSFLSKYMKQPQFKSSLNKHEVYFRSINKQRTDKLYEVYEKYLVKSKIDESKVPKAGEYEKVKNKRNLEEDIIPIIRKRRDEQRSEDKSIEVVPSRTEPSIKPSVAAGTDSRMEAKKVTKRLTKEFMECAIDDLINLISRMLKSLISLNDKSVPASISNPKDKSSTNRVLTRYHSRTPPGISIHTYLTRLTKFNSFTPATLLTTIYYIDLLSHHYQPFFTLNSWTVHRFLLVATMLSQKLMEDFFYTNEHYAKVGGVAISELNCLELDFLNRVDWRCVPAKQLENGKSSIRFAKDVLDLYYAQLIQLMGKNISADDEVLYFASADDSYFEEAGNIDAGADIDIDIDEDDDEDDDDYVADYVNPTTFDLSTNQEKYYNRAQL